MAPNEWRLTGFEPRAFEAGLVWMELKSRGLVTTRPIAQHTVLLGDGRIGSIMIYILHKWLRVYAWVLTCGAPCIESDDIRWVSYYPIP